MKKKNKLMTVSIALTCLAATHVFAGVIISDDFSSADGTLLKNTSPDIGSGANWSIIGNVLGVEITNETVVVNTSGTNFGGITDLASLNDTMLSISVDYFAGSGGSLFFGFIDDGSTFVNVGDDLFFQVVGDGARIIVKDGVSGAEIDRVEAAAYTWNPADWNTVGMLINTSAGAFGTAQLVVNGTTLTNLFELTEAPDLENAAFMLNTPEVQITSVDNLSVVVPDSLISDDFNSVDGTLLKNTAPDVGPGAGWSIIGSALDVEITNETLLVTGAGVNYGGIADMPSFSGTSLSISIDYFAGAGANLFFGFIDDGATFVNAGDDLFLQVVGDGVRIIVKDGVDGTEIGRVDSADYVWNVDGWNTVGMDIDTSAGEFGAAQLVVNGATLTNILELTESPDFENAALMFNGPEERVTAVDNFSIIPGLTAVAAVIGSIEWINDDLLKLSIISSDVLDGQRLVATSDLVNGLWSYIAHSSDGTNEFVVTNLSYSTVVDATNCTIYVHATNSAAFFGIE